MDMEWDVRGFFPSQPEIPSREIHKRWVRAYPPSDKENIVVDYQKGGKWLLFFDQVHKSDVTGLTELDYSWQFIKKMVENQVLYRAKASTPLKGICEAYDRSKNGIICCYTVDYTNKKDVKRAADAIRKVIHISRDLYYKTDNDTRAGIYKHKGDNFVCIYKHTVEGEMFERDTIFKYQWNLVNA